MQGYPKFLNTKEDYMNMLEIDAPETVRRLQMLLDQSFQFQYVRDLSDDEDGIEDENHRIETWTEMGQVENEGDIPEEGKVYRAQFKRMFHETSELARLGFTVDEVKQLIEQHSESEAND